MVSLFDRDGGCTGACSQRVDIKCCAGEMLHMDSWAWVELMRRLWLSQENVNSFTGRKSAMSGVATDIQPSCWRMGQCTHVVAMT